ncbi:MAG TPA: hypothetical protein VGS11_05265, partial [Candidatus Bathyarchaeia archaeon]|nr:hypothetical protein [Candidatus Bathyarchaeia archaeon]
SLGGATKEEGTQLGRLNVFRQRFTKGEVREKPAPRGVAFYLAEKVVTGKRKITIECGWSVEGSRSGFACWFRDADLALVD